MSESALPPRPRQLMLAAGIVIGGSLLHVASVFDALGSLQSVDVRKQLQEVVSSGAGRDLGVTLDQVTAGVRAGLNVAGVCAAVAFVLGIFVLQRHRGARVGLSVLAVPLLVTAPLAGGFLGALVAVASLMLWAGPAGDWYAGRPIRETGRPRKDREDRPDRSGMNERSTTQPNPVSPPASSPTGGLSTRAPSAAPDATHDFGAPDPEPADAAAGQLAAADVPVAAPPATSPEGVTTVGPPPPPVRLACLVAGVFSGIVALLYLAAVVALLVDREAIVDRVVDAPAWKDSGLEPDLLVPLLWFGVLLFLAWSLGAVALAWLTYRHHDWARYLLAVSAGLTLVMGVVAFPLGVVHQVACVVTMIALFNPRSRAWFRRRVSAPGRRSAGD